MTEEFRGKTVAVVGLARSGAACADVLTRLGARVQVYDNRPEPMLNPAHVAAVRALGIEPSLGGAPVNYVGLDILITSPGVPKNAPVLQDAVAAGIPVWGEIEAAYRVARAPILAITGTNGKTTTTMLLGEMLRAAGMDTYIAGNIAAGDIAMPLIQAAYQAGPEAAIVAEISSFQLEWVSTFRPKVAALLNITPDHADRQTWDEYVSAKWRIFAYQTADDHAVLSENLNSGGTLRAMEWAFGNVLSEEYGVWRGGEVVQSDNDPVYLRRDLDDKEWPLICRVAEIKLPGAHNVENVMAAAAMATAFGIGLDPIRQVATTFTGVVHRLEYVETKRSVRYVNNSMCTNVAAFARSLEALPEPKVVIAGGVFKGSAAEMGEWAQALMGNNVRALVLIGQSAAEMEDAARGAGYANLHQAVSLAEAVRTAQGLAQAGDTVLLAPACASFDMFTDFEERGEQFKQCARSLPD